MARRLGLLFLLALLVLAPGCSQDPIQGTKGPWRHRLYSGVYFNKIAGMWFLVDTWHHRILYSNTPHPDLRDWNTLTENIGGPHSVATDGEIVVYDDTGYGHLRAARYFNLENFLIDDTGGGNAEEYEIVYDVGMRPHRVLYDDSTRSFFAVSSGTQEILRVTNEAGRLVVRHRQPLPFLNQAYTRSMSIIDGHMYFVTRGQGIMKSTYRDDEYKLVERYPVPEILYDLIDVFRSEAGWYYLTAWPRGILRARSLEDLVAGDYEDLYEELGLTGTPYYLAEVEGRLYLPQVGDSNGVISFADSESGPVSDVQVLYDFGPPEPPDEWRKGHHPR